MSTNVLYIPQLWPDIGGRWLETLERRLGKLQGRRIVQTVLSNLVSKDSLVCCWSRDLIQPNV